MLSLRGSHVVSRQADIAKVLTFDEARRIAVTAGGEVSVRERTTAIGTKRTSVRTWLRSVSDPKLTF